MSDRFLGVCVVLGALGCGRSELDVDVLGCITDLECKGGRICVLGVCEERPVSSGGNAGLGSGASSHGGTSPGGTGASAGASAMASGAGGFANAAGSVGSSGSAGSGAVVNVDMMPVRLEVDANRLAADRAHGKLYAVVGKDAASHANELLVIDAEHASIEASVTLGPNPDTLAISDDGTRLWVGLHDALTVREVDLTKSPPEPLNEYPVPVLSFEDQGVYAGKMVVVPGHPESIAFTLRCPGCVEVDMVVLDSGTPRPNRVGGSSQLTSGPEGYLFGFDDHDTGFDFQTLALDPMGITVTNSRGLIYGFQNEIIYDAGYVFAVSGQVLDVSTPQSPLLAGTFGYQGEVVPHVARDTALMLSNVGPPPYIPPDTKKQLVIRRLNLPAFREELETPLAGNYTLIHDFVEVASGLFAFIDTVEDDFHRAPPQSAVYVFKASDFAE